MFKIVLFQEKKEKMKNVGTDSYSGLKYAN